MRLLGISCCLLLSLVASPLLAQSDTAAKAAIVFDVRMEKVTNSPLGKALALKEQMASMPRDPDGPDMSKLVRIYAATTAPEGMEELQQVQMGQMPLDFFVRFEFDSAEAAESMMVKPKEKNGGSFEKNGVTVYKAPEGGDMPANIVIYSPSDKTVEMGTESFAFRADSKPFTDGAKAAWGKAADEAVRLAIDMESAKNLIEQVVAQGKQSAPPMAAPYLELLKKMKSLTLTLDLSGKNLVTLQATGKSASEATEIKEALDSLIGLAKMGGKEQAKMMAESDPEGAKIVNALLDGMNAAADGENVTFSIPKPEGYEAVVTKMVQGMMGGMNGNF